MPSLAIPAVLRPPPPTTGPGLSAPVDIVGPWRRSMGLVAARPCPRPLPPILAVGKETVEIASAEASNGSVSGKRNLVMSTVGNSTNIVWHECLVGKLERQKLLKQKGCVIWITGLSGSGKSTLACALSRELYSREYLTYVLDGDNIRHGLNRDLSFKAEDRAENIRRVGELAKLFADAGVICIASLISPYRRDRDACRALLPDSTFIEVFMNIPLEVCEARDPKGLYKLARAGKIKGFTGIDDPYEPPLDCEIVIEAKAGECPSPVAMADQVISYLNNNGFLQA
ncbi:adenylyl-sulfate kinase 3-like isoform X1 [Phoenix dactylifera]|uniref:Adenylyl-sulfate kinase n=1 Tax=Phoenix dactylifera TaxID=42345 RepID=A0A8B7BX41_PHODC|nr:adenylyl-sulfate kinase 3-like isoform X1 [Phoenix dactylifera]